MWTTLLLAATFGLSANEAGPLRLTNVRATYGALGAPRAAHQVLPGDQVFIAFEIEGITADASGRVLYSMTTEIRDSNNKLLFKQEPRDQEAINALGGGTLPAFVELNAGLEQPAGTYVVTVTVTDRANKQSQSLTQKFQLLEKAFGLVRLTTTSDAEGHAHAGLFQVGSTLWVNGQVVGFGRADKGQPQVAVELRVLDEGGKPTLDKPFSGVIEKDVPAGAHSLPVQFAVALNRAGKFTVELKATDRVGKKTSVVTFPVTVVALK